VGHFAKRIFELGEDLFDGIEVRTVGGQECPSRDLVDIGLSGLALCPFGGDIQKGRMKPLTIVISFDAGELVVPGDIPGFGASPVRAFGFHSAEADF